MEVESKLSGFDSFSKIVHSVFSLPLITFPCVQEKYELKKHQAHMDRWRIQ